MTISASVSNPQLFIMSRYSKEERVRIVQVYTRTMSLTEVQRDYRIHFRKTSPSINTIKSLNLKFTSTGRLNSIRTEAVIAGASTDVADNPKTSIRKRSFQLGIYRSSLQRILKSDLQLYPYKLQLGQ